jgi:hypothetical protein
MTATPRVGDSALARGSRAVACEIGLTSDSCGSAFLLAGGTAFRIDCSVLNAATTKMTRTMVMVSVAMRIVHLTSALRGVVLIRGSVLNAPLSTTCRLQV